MKKTAFIRLNQLLLLLMAAGMLDTCVAAARSPSHVLMAVAGEETSISGKLAGTVLPPLETGTLFAENKITDPDQLSRLLSVDPVIPGITIRFIERNGRMWRAVLFARPGRTEGEHWIHVLQPGETPGEQNLYQLKVFANAAAKRRAAPSFVLRYLGIQPWWLAIGLMPAAAAMLFSSWRNSRREEHRLRAQGLGVIYKLARRKDGWELTAGLGTADGVRTGEKVFLLSRDLAPVAAIRVLSAHPDYLTAKVGLEIAVKPDGYVARNDPACHSSPAGENGVEVRC